MSSEANETSDIGAISDDDAFLDELFDGALQAWSRGRAFDVASAVAPRPHLREQAEELARLAGHVAVQHPTRRPAVKGYDILSELGAGGMGTVFLARQTSLGRQVALKLLPPSAFLSERSRQRLLAEARGLAKVRHPNIVAVHDVIEADDVCGYAMEWIDGCSLAALLAGLRDIARHEARRPRMDDVPAVLGAGGAPPADVTLTVWLCRLGIAVARALAEVHRAGLVHRDVKPGNILLRRDGRPVLSDFGLVRDDSDAALTRTGRFVGTPAYAAPEQVRGERGAIGPRTDVYALGVTLYECFALRPPFRATSPADLARFIEGGVCEPLQSADRELPRDLQTVVAKAMEPDPARRYASADELADDLQRLLDLQPIRARPATTWARTVKFVRRRRAALGGLLLGGALAAAAASALVWYAVQRAEVPGRVADHLHRARLVLLAPPAAGFGSLQDALAWYDAALALDPDRDDVRVEREVVALVLARQRGDGGQAPAGWSGDTGAASTAGTKAGTPGVSSWLAERCPCTTDVVARWPLHGPPPATPSRLEAITREDRHALGLLGWLSAAPELCHVAWATFDFGPASDPLVDGAFGELMLALGYRSIALPRLTRAFQEWPEAGFLAQDLAVGASELGDVTAAARYLQRARELRGVDHATLADVEWRCREAGVDVSADTQSYEGWLRDLLGLPGDGLRLGRFFSQRGAWAEAVRVEALAVQAAPGDVETAIAFLDDFGTWWESIRGRGQAAAIARAARGQDSDPVRTWWHLRRTATLATPASSLILQRVSRGDLAFSLEVLQMERTGGSMYARLPESWRERWAEVSLALGRWFDADADRPTLARAAARASVAAGVLATLVLTAPARSQDVIQVLVGGAGGDYFGWSVGGAGDVNGDGHADLIVGAPYADPAGSDSGLARVVSGLDGSTIWTFPGDAADSLCGWNVDGVGDYDSDGKADVIVGIPFSDSAGNESGLIRIYSGADGSILYAQDCCSPFNVGFSVAGAGDVNTDGIPDFIYGAPNWNGTRGLARVHQGGDGTGLYSLLGDNSGDYLGISVDIVGDLDGDDHAEFAVAAPQRQSVHFGSATTGPGYVRVYSGLDGSQLFQFNGTDVGENFGQGLAGVGDVDADGTPDIAVSAGLALSGNGRVTVFSGADGSVLHTFAGYVPAVGGASASVDGLGDIDHDGHADILVQGDALYAFSGSDGSVLFRVLREDVGTDYFAYEAAGAGDVDGDGAPDFIVGAAGDSVNGTNSGGAYVIEAGCGTITSYGAGCAGSGGFTPLLAVKGCASPNGSITLSINNALGGATAYLLLSTTQNSQALKGCTLLVGLPLLPLIVTLPLSGVGAGNGALSLPATIPAGTAGLTLTMQAWISDLGGPLNFSNTNGVELAIQ